MDNSALGTVRPDLEVAVLFKYKRILKKKQIFFKGSTNPVIHIVHNSPGSDRPWCRPMAQTSGRQANASRARVPVPHRLVRPLHAQLAEPQECLRRASMARMP